MQEAEDSLLIASLLNFRVDLIWRENSAAQPPFL